MRRWQSGQLQETVNLPDLSYVGSNPTRRTIQVLYLKDMDENEIEQRERLINVLGSLEDLTKKQVSIKFIFLRGAIYGLGTVIGATVLLSVVSYFFVQIFGVDIITSLQN